MRLVRSIATIGGFTLGSRLVGFVREMLVAHFLGRGMVADAFILSIKLPSMFRRIFAEGAFNAAFVPMISGLFATKGEAEAKTYAEEILSILIVTLIVFVGLFEIFMPEVLGVFARGFKDSPERMSLAVQFSRITFPFILFISLTALYSGVLNSLERFAAAAASPMMGNLAIIATVYFCTGFIESAPGRAFAIGIVVCGIVQLLWVVVPVMRRGMTLRLRLPRWTPRVQKFMTLLMPAIAGSGVVQVSLLLDVLIATYLPQGGIAAIHYADRLIQLPISVLGTAVGTALLPLLSKQIRAQDADGACESQNLALEYSFLMTLPAMIGLSFLAEPLVRILFEHGKFTAADTVATAAVVQALALGLPAYILLKVLSASFFARENTTIPFIGAGIGVCVNVVVAVLLLGRLQQVGIALATAVSAWVNVGFLVILLYRRGFLELTPRFRTFFPRVLVASFLTILMIGGSRVALENMLHGIKIYQVLALLLLVGGGIGSFLVFARFSGALNFKDVRTQMGMLS